MEGNPERRDFRQVYKLVAAGKPFREAGGLGVSRFRVDRFWTSVFACFRTSQRCSSVEPSGTAPSFNKT